MFENFKKKARALKKKTTALYLAYLNKKVSWYKRAFILLVLIYALSPIDLIPDFIPVLGLLDDLIVIPFGVWIAVKMIPKEIWQECVTQVEQGVVVERKYKIVGLILICSIWGLLIYRFILLFV
jgi:uncharacterized membrane protein YkvA (DUF1232 family)